MIISGSMSFLLLMFCVIILSGSAFKYSVDHVRHGDMEGLENMQKQNFNLTPGTYPATLDSLLLSPEYPTPGTILGANTEPDTSSSSLVASATILGTGYPAPTNNSRYPASPDNNTCMPMIMCNSFYGMRNERSKDEPPAIPLSDHRRRVNYYASELPIVL